jgi:peroxiredoxin
MIKLIPRRASTKQLATKPYNPCSSNVWAYTISIKSIPKPPTASRTLRHVNQLLKAGQKAPEFAAKDVYGHKVDLSVYDKPYVLVAFMRYAGCPYCNLAVHRLSVEYPLLQQNDCNVIVFVQSESSEIIKNIYDRHELKPPFPIIPDLAKYFYDIYGVQSSKRAFFQGQIAAVPYWLQSVGKHGFKPGKLEGDYFLVPAMFLVRTRDMQILNARYGSSYYDHAAFTPIYESLTFDVATA